MKLPIKKKYFDQIKSGKKKFELRDAHITFVCEKTGRTIRKNITDVSIDFRRNFSGYDDVLEDDKIIVFDLE